MSLVTICSTLYTMHTILGYMDKSKQIWGVVPHYLYNVYCSKISINTGRNDMTNTELGIILNWKYNTLYI